MPAPEAWGFVEPEELTAYEVGFKGALADGSLQLNGAAFFYDYEDKQFLAGINTSVGPAATLGNIPEAENKGIEIDAWWRATDALDIKFGVGWLDSEIIEAPVDIRGIPFVGTVQQGDPLSFSPELSYNALVRYAWEFGGNLTAAVQADYSHKDDMTAILGDGSSRTEDLESLGARVSIGPADGRWPPGGVTSPTRMPSPTATRTSSATGRIHFKCPGRTV